jgi:DNA gyrase subunit A
VLGDILGDISDEELIPNISVLVTISGNGYVKRMPTTTYRAQRRGGKGIRGQVLREEDALRHMVTARARDNLLFFTDRGRVFQLKAYELREFERTARGLPVNNFIQIESGETVTAVLAAPDFENNKFLIMATRLGEVKKTSLADFASVRRNGLIAMDLEPNDELCWVKHCPAGADIILVSEQGQALRFGVDALRSASRTSGGVRGMRLAKGDRLAGMDVVDPQGDLLLITQLGNGKRVRVREYTPHGRGTGGIKTLTITPKTGPVGTVRSAHGAEEVMLISSGGTILRTPLALISRQGRAARGVTVMDLKPGESVAAVALLDGEDEGDDGGESANGGRAAEPKGRGRKPAGPRGGK